MDSTSGDRETAEEYLQRVGMRPTHRNYSLGISILESYGENRWWLSDDPCLRAYYQTEVISKIGILILPQFSSYQKDLLALLQRQVGGAEINKNRVQKLWQDVQDAAQQQNLIT